MQNGSSVLVGSEETEPENGWPYDRILSSLTKGPSTNANELGATIVGKYLASYTAADLATQSALDLTRIQAVQDAVNGLGRTLKKGLANDSVRTSLMTVRNQVQSYDTEDYIDLLDFCSLLKAGTTDPDVQDACRSVEEAAAPFILKSGFKGKGVAHSRGVSIYYPTKEVSTLYSKLDFARKGTWDEFLKAYVSANRRRS